MPAATNVKHDGAFRRAKLLLVEADKEDRAAHFESALQLYKQGCAELLEALKYATDATQRSGYKAAMTRYISRAEVIKTLVARENRRVAAEQWRPEAMGGAGAALCGAHNGSDADAADAWRLRTGDELAGSTHQLGLVAAEDVLANTPAEGNGGVGVRAVVFFHVYSLSGFEAQVEELVAALQRLHDNTRPRGAARLVVLSTTLPELDYHALLRDRLPFALAVPWRDKRLAASLVRRFFVGSNGGMSSVAVVNNATGAVLRRSTSARDLGSMDDWFAAPANPRAHGGPSAPSTTGTSVTTAAMAPAGSAAVTQVARPRSIFAPKNSTWMAKLFGPHLRQSNGSTMPTAQVRACVCTHFTRLCQLPWCSLRTIRCYLEFVIVYT